MRDQSSVWLCGQSLNRRTGFEPVWLIRNLRITWSRTTLPAHAEARKSKGNMVSHVFVVDSERKPLNPVHPGRARRLLTDGKAAVLRRFPFTIILKVAVPDAQTDPLRVKIDPGSKTTGLAMVNDANGDVVWAAELSHRGQQIVQNLDNRRMYRRSRRQRHTRYRQPRFHNRRRSAGWLPPSLESRIRNVVTWVQRLQRYAPIAALSQELTRFDTQALQNPEISGVEYQQGTLAGYELREYLLEKWERRCAYCRRADLPLQVEHIVPKARGGSNRVSNLTLACESCNQQKGTQTAEEFGFPDLHKQAQKPLKDAAVLNATRWTLFRRLQTVTLPVETGTGGRTKWNRTQRGIPKTHWCDAACVGSSTPQALHWQPIAPLLIVATGWQRRQMCLMDAYGFPRTKAKRQSRVQGFKTGDIVRAVVPTGVKVGTYVGRVAVRATGSFNITAVAGVVQGIPARACSAIHRQDGYRYEKGAALCPQA
jgi:5-methylcytosine-specific restriction endonuclease McrA